MIDLLLDWISPLLPDDGSEAKFRSMLLGWERMDNQRETIHTAAKLRALGLNDDQMQRYQERMRQIDAQWDRVKVRYGH